MTVYVVRSAVPEELDMVAVQAIRLAAFGALAAVSTESPGALAGIFRTACIATALVRAEVAIITLRLEGVSTVYAVPHVPSVALLHKNCNIFA